MCRESVQSLRDRGDAAHDEDDRNVSDLLLDQIEFANVILLNKIDLVTQDEAKRLCALLRALNPTAKVIQTINSEVELKEIISTGLFSFEEASQSAGWLKSMQEETPHTPETEEYGISSFVFKARRPFHPIKIHRFMTEHFALQEPDWSDAIADTKMDKIVKEAQDSLKQALDHLEESKQAIEGLKSLKVASSSVDSLLQSLKESMESVSSTSNALVELQNISAEETVGGHGASSSGTSEASKAFESLKKKYGNVLRSKGFIWLASRPDLCGEWSQAGAVLRFTVGGPWYASLPDEAWPEDEQDRLAILNDFVEPHGDRRQELVFIGIDMDKDALHKALEDCLLEDHEMGHELHDDPFGEWPALEDILDGGDEDDHDHEHCTDHNHNHITQDIEGDAITIQLGTVVKITDGASEAQQILDSLQPDTTVIIYWHAEWHAEGSEISRDIESHVTNLNTLVLHVDIGNHPPNWSFAMEKVMTKPEARRAGAKPVLKNGLKWPCFTVHNAPDLQPIDTIAGAHAVNSVKKIISSLPEAPAGASSISISQMKSPTEGIASDEGNAPISISSIPSPAMGATPEAVLSFFPRLENGAVELREHLKSFTQQDKSLCIVWEENGLPLKVLKGLQSIVSIRPETNNIFIADVGASPGNKALAKALGVKGSPSMLIFRNMKLDKKFDGPDKVVDALAQEYRTLPAEVLSVPGKPLSKSQPNTTSEPSLYDPPKGKQNRSGSTKLTPDGKLVHYFPNMPCLRCGNPWWTSDDWDALCVRCKWNCLTGGYDDNSKPLPQHKAVWQKYVDSIKSGITPAWKGSK